MELKVFFLLTVNIHSLEKNYTGTITVQPDRVCKPVTLHFLVLNPYAGGDSEFSVFEDKEMQIPFAEAVGEREQGFNPQTGKPVTRYDFGLKVDDLKVGLLTVTAMIISEGIYQAELRFKAGEVPPKGSIPSYQFKHVWQQNFTGEAGKIAQSFLLYFGK